MKIFLKKIFYPMGKHHKMYTKYIAWSFVSNLCVSIQTAMTTNNMLNAISSPEDTGYRTLNYIGKDVIGQVGGLIYMAKISEKADKNPGLFLTYSNFLQQSSFLLLSSTCVFDSCYFLPIAGLANALSNISFTGYGAINAKCIQNLSHDNIGEIYSKITLINTLASSIGLGIGIILCTVIPDEKKRFNITPLIGMFRIYSFNRATSFIIK